MPSPVEYRYYLKKITLQDIANGMNPVKLPNAQGQLEMFQPPVLQFRFKEKVFLNGAPSLEWSDWISVQVVKEGSPDGDTPGDFKPVPSAPV